MLALADYRAGGGWQAVAGFVFVSYSRRDPPYVKRLVDRLQQAGVPVWRDTEGIEYGDR